MTIEKLEQLSQTQETLNILVKKPIFYLETNICCCLKRLYQHCSISLCACVLEALRPLHMKPGQLHKYSALFLYNYHHFLHFFQLLRPLIKPTYGGGITLHTKKCNLPDDDQTAHHKA